MGLLDVRALGESGYQVAFRASELEVNWRGYDRYVISHSGAPPGKTDCSQRASQDVWNSMPMT